METNQPETPHHVSRHRKHIKGRAVESLNVEACLELLHSFDYVMADYEGVLVNHDALITGSPIALMDLKKMGKTFICVTNDSKSSDREYITFLKDYGIHKIEASHIVYPLKVIISYLKSYLTGSNTIFSLLNPEMNNTLVQNGINVKFMNRKLVNLKNMDNLRATEPLVQAVVLDTNINLTYSDLALAQQYLKSSDCSLIVTTTDPYLKLSKDVTTIGLGGLINILCEDTQKEPIVLGKPSVLLREDLLHRFHITDPERVLYVGSNHMHDIVFGNECKFQTLYLWNGPSGKIDLVNISENLKPDYVCENLSIFVKSLKEAASKAVR